MQLDRFITLYLFEPLTRRRMANGFTIPILMYHSISNERETGHPYFWINTSPERFAEHMKYLYDSKYRVISLSEAADMIGVDDGEWRSRLSIGRRLSAEKVVVLTFDDGYQDFHTHAFPVLNRYGFTATVFLPTDFIGNGRPGLRRKQHLTWDQVRGLAAQGITFGSHTVKHSTLYGLPWKDVRKELLDSRLRLENELQTPTHCFAYPFAFPREDSRFVLLLRQELVAQGYHNAVTTVIGCMRRECDPLCLERLPINERDDIQLYAAKLLGAYNWLAGIQVFVRKMKRYLLRDRHLNL